jgi:hypothetical protein
MRTTSECDVGLWIKLPIGHESIGSFALWQ